MQNTNPNEKMIRTQISLTPELKQHAELKARARGISISSYIRQTIYRDIQENATKQEEVQSIITRIKNLKKTKVKDWQSAESIDKWVRDIRKDKE